MTIDDKKPSSRFVFVRKAPFSTPRPPERSLLIHKQIRKSTKLRETWRLASNPPSPPVDYQGVGLEAPRTSLVPNSAFIMMWVDRTLSELNDASDAINEVCPSFEIRTLRADDVERQDRTTDLLSLADAGSLQCLDTAPREFNCARYRHYWLASLSRTRMLVSGSPREFRVRPDAARTPNPHRCHERFQPAHGAAHGHLGDCRSKNRLVDDPLKTKCLPFLGTRRLSEFTSVPLVDFPLRSPLLRRRI